MWVWSIRQLASVSVMSSFICHFQLFPSAVISLWLSESPEMPSDRWMRGCWTRQTLFYSAACYSSCCCSGGRSRCVYLLCYPHPPSPFLFAYRCNTTAMSGRQPFHCSCTSFTYRCSFGCCPPHLVEGTGSKSLWYLAPRHPELVMLRAFSLSFLPGQRLQQSAADGRHLVSVALKPNCRTQSQVFASVSLLPLLCWSRANPACTQLLDAFYPCTHLELLAVLALMVCNGACRHCHHYLTKNLYSVAKRKVCHW